MSYLLGAGCAVNATDHAGLTPLLCAAAALETDAHVDVILRLLQEGADPDAKRLDDDLCALELVELASPVTLLQHRTPSGEAAWLARIMSNSESAERCPSTRHSALKILWRQCSEFAWANIISSASDGSRPIVANASTR